MKRPIARPTASKQENPATAARAPRAFTPPGDAAPVESFSGDLEPLELAAAPPRRKSWLWRAFLGAAGLLISLGLYLAAENLIRDLFARYEWLGWGASVALGILVFAAVLLAINELRALWRLKQLDGLRENAAEVLASDDAKAGRALVAQLQALYAPRPDLARPRTLLDQETRNTLDGADMIRSAERHLMSPLDRRAKALTSAAARRVAIVTAISPRALVDVAFVAYESIRLARAIATLYGARPGLIGSWRLFGAVLGHLAITGGVALGDSVIQQLLGHGLAAKLSARLGEGLVNGLMTARVGIAAMRVTRPLPFDALKQPVVMDFATELGRLAPQDAKG